MSQFAESDPILQAGVAGPREPGASDDAAAQPPALAIPGPIRATGVADYSPVMAAWRDLRDGAIAIGQASRIKDLDNDTLMDGATTFAGRAEVELIERIAEAAGFDLAALDDDHDRMNFHADPLAVHRENGRVFMLVPTKDGSPGAGGYFVRPVVVADPAPGRPAGRVGEPIESPAIVRSSYMLDGRMFAVEGGVVAASDLDEVCPGWSDEASGWSVWPVHDVPGDLRIVQRLFSMTAEEFVKEAAKLMFTLPGKGAAR